MNKAANPSAGRSQEPTGAERLDSWKEIAAYLKREVRTVQRWEKREGLPVHRHLHDKLGSVYAFKSELDAWWSERRPRLEPEPEAGPEAQEEEPPPEVEAKAPRAPTWPWRPHAALLRLAAVVLLALGGGYFIRSVILPRHPKGEKIKLAVLPFRNLSNDPQEYFSDGLTSEMTTQLGRLHPNRLGVIAYTSTIAYKNISKSIEDICAELGVNYILEGSVRRAADRVRIDAQLIQCGDQTHLWAESYDRDLRDILALQSDVARAVARSIELTLTPQEQARLAGVGPVNPPAFEAYLKGRYYWNHRTAEDIQKSVGFFQQAIRLQPDYALAYSGIADYYALLAAIGTEAVRPREARPKAKEAALKALKLDDSLAEAHASLAYILHNYDWDWTNAEKEYLRAIELNPNYPEAHHWYAHHLMQMGRTEEALTQSRLAQSLDPLSLSINNGLARMYYLARQYDKAIVQCRKTLEIDSNYYGAHAVLGMVYEQQSRPQDAIAEFFGLQHPESPAAYPPVVLGLLGHAYALAGRKEEAKAVLDRLVAEAKQGKRYIPASYVALIYIGLGQKEQAFTWLHKSVEERSEAVLYLKAEPVVDPLRSDPRFPKLLGLVGLPQ